MVEETAEVSNAVSDDEIDEILAAESFLPLGKPRSRLAFIAKAAAEQEAQQASFLRSRGAQIGCAVLTNPASKVSADTSRLNQAIDSRAHRASVAGNG